MLHAPPLGALLRRYAAGTALTCEPVDEGLLNRGYRLRTTRGRYFLKHHFDPDTADPAAIARQHRATERLADLGVPVAPPLPGRDGHTVAVVGGHAYALHPWIDGRHRHGAQLTPGQCGRLGALLGVVHAGLEHVMRAAHGERPPPARGGHVPRRPGADTPPARVPESDPEHGLERSPEHRATCPERHARGAVTASAERTAPAARTTPVETTAPAPSPDPADTFVLIDDLLARVHRHRPADSFDELARHRLVERRALLERHADRRPPHGGPVGWVHGDFHPFNLLYRGDAPAAIVDWDRLGVQPRAEEAVRAAAIFFVRPDGSLDLPKAREYARAYRRAAGATPCELTAAVHRVWWERLNDFWMLRWHYERGDTRADSQFPAASALAVWWTREYDAVCGAFAD
ncbi:phosphotransferase [Streptomyces rishiriensis]|uniref:Ser/Thr protein kinase RdoA (MazF antagonist) n=1 Tax=Streptomyces rishiriensis TaxID=68264 RepID=A0ABU0NU49_STRRH|nr:phosphotransferase [Streptomyces rishiriensis]MDQ0582238.1 Ser/Thr protein kinase RdoA (MazF antagonist) [Streptomyces rishiriensis]